ncbi:MAG: hypothetical protein IIU66_00900 [Clostridia bacterium]|nr:hypothetical protein [Clostridia bacterium]
MDYNKQTVYNASGVYKEAGGGGGGVPFDDYFDIVDNIYQNNTLNNYSPLKLSETINNDDFKIEAKYYIGNPNLGEFPGCFFNFNTNSSYSQLVYLLGNGASNPRSFRYGNNYKSKDETVNLLGEADVFCDAPMELKLINTNFLLTSAPGTVTLTHIWPVPHDVSTPKGNNYKIGVKKFVLTKKSTNKVICDFTPVKRKIDNVVGLFEAVSGTFYTSSYFGYR